MLFAHDTIVALTAAAALVNTEAGNAEDGGQPDLLQTVADLDAFVTAWEWTGRREHSRAELDAVRALRSRLRGIWQADDEQVVEVVNALLAEAQALPRLVRHDEWDWHLHATGDDAPLADRMAVEAAMGLVDVVRTGELHRLRVCSADNCEDVFVDLSKNRSRRYCENGCGNRANVAAYRARLAGEA